MGEKKRGKVVLVSVLLCSLMFSNVIFSAAKCLPRNMKMQIQNRSSIAALDSPFVFLVQGDVLHTGVFYAVVSIGTPAKNYFLDIDTGSELTWVQCSPSIANLPKEPRYLEGPNPLYKPPPANNICPPPHQNGGCEYEVSYADSGSSIGLLVQDSFLLQSIPPPSYSPTLTFGCGYHQEYSGPSPPPFVDGVFGLGNGETSILMQLNKQGLIPKVVGHCLSANGGDGFLFLGNPQQFLNPTSLFLWTHILPNPILEQQVNLVGPIDLYYGDQALGANGLNVVFDSGTTFNYFNSQTYQATFQLLNELANRVGVEAEDNYLPDCWEPNNSIDDFKNSFNSLQLRFTNENANVYFALVPNDYLVDSPDGNVCLGILDGEVFGPELQNLNIIGDISLLDKLVIYDYEKQQIGWGSIECSRRPYF